MEEVESVVAAGEGISNRSTASEAPSSLVEEESVDSLEQSRFWGEDRIYDRRIQSSYTEIGRHPAEGDQRQLGAEDESGLTE